MKRYNMNAIGEAYPNALGLWSMYSDLQEWALRHKATVEGMEHDEACPAATCYLCGNEDAIIVTHMLVGHPASGQHEYTRGECNCPRGDALREIEELL